MMNLVFGRNSKLSTTFAINGRSLSTASVQFNMFYDLSIVEGAIV